MKTNIPFPLHAHQWLRTERIDAVTPTLQRFSHTLNNHRSITTMCIDLLSSKVRNLPDAQEELQMLREALHKLDRITEHMGLFCRGSRTRTLLTCDLHELLSAQLAEKQPQLPPSIGCLYDFAAQHTRIDFPIENFRHFFDAVWNNACEAMPYGGTLQLKTQDEILGYPAPLPQGRYCVLQFADSGEGAETSEIETWFEPFFSTKQHHQGMGLSLAYGLIKQSKGGIRIQSVPHIGTSFAFYFPVRE